MSIERVQGLAAANSMLAAVPGAAQDELLVEFALIGADFRKAQQAQLAATTHGTGYLASRLAVLVLIERLRVRTGIIGTQKRQGSGRSARRNPGGSLGSIYYGRFVAYGRREQTVNVTRRAAQAAIGRIRNRGPNKGTPVGSAYKLRVKSKAANPFIDVPNAQEIAAQRLADFWAGVLARIGA